MAPTYPELPHLIRCRVSMSSGQPRQRAGRFGSEPLDEPELSLGYPMHFEPLGVPEGMEAVFDSAARLQQVVPDAVLVGGTVSALYAGHRVSFDHDHVLRDLADRYQAVLEAVEATEGWATSVRASKPPVTIMGRLGGVEAGLRQVRRTTALEVAEFELDDGHRIRIPTAAEALRVKAYLIVQRNQVRDYLDVAAMTDRYGVELAGSILRGIDGYYRDRSEMDGSVSSMLALRLADPQPRDERTIHELASYKGLAPRWTDWGEVRQVCAQLAQEMLDQ